MNGINRMSRSTQIVVVLATVSVLAGGITWWLLNGKQHQVVIRYGITPYQDSALPVVPAKLGWYRDAGLNVELVPATWGDVVTAISAGAIDVAVYNFNSFQAPYENAAQGPRRPVFYCPLFLFKGQAIMIKAGSSMVPFKDVPGEDAATRDRRVADA